MRILLLAPVVLLSGVWACAALWIDGPAARPLAGALIGGFVLTTLAGFVRLRPLRRALALYAALFLAVLGWWLALEPSNDRDWAPSVRNLPRAEFDGDRVTIHNVRNFDYRTEAEFEEVWETRSWDLSKLTGVDISFTHWASPYIAHTMVSWVFSEGPPLVISIEARKEADEGYSALLGFFRQFELYYVVADERDLIRLRTNYRQGEEVYLFHLNSNLDRARAILRDYLRVINEINEEPRWYNALTHNCTTAIQHHIDNVAPGDPFDWRVLVNGKLPELGYEEGTLDTSMPYEELRRRSWINEKARAADQDPLFWERIRAGLPGY